MRYRTIVGDPPWPHKRTGVGFGRSGNSQRWSPGETRTTDIPYAAMSVTDIANLPVNKLANREAHLYLWTTQKFLRDGFDVLEAWGFAYSNTLVWCKQPRGFNMGGTYASTTEFLLFGRRGTLAAQRREQRQWFTWPRPETSVAYGRRKTATHSVKPEAFLDLVEQVSPGPYLELFARRQRLGWDTWGDQALEHVEMTA